jgi:phospholipid/cholesterol/gamma-HCH transport system permease protein
VNGQPHRRNVVESLGAAVLTVVSYLGGMSLLLQSALRAGWRGSLSRRSARESLASQMVRVGVRSVGIVCLVQVFIGVILALQMAPPLSTWKQEPLIANIIGVAGFRMLGPIITAVVLSGFAGASIVPNSRRCGPTPSVPCGSWSCRASLRLS